MNFNPHNKKKKERFVGRSDTDQIWQVDEGHCFDSAAADFLQT